jgi:uncharacterized protein YbjT (DUF2867 family)
MSKKAIVFGATGLVGQELIFELLADESFTSVLAVTRKPLPLSHPKLETIIVQNFTNLSNYKNQISGDIFFCCLGTTIKTAGSQEAFSKVDYDIPVSIATLAAELEVPALAVISSIGADASSSNFYLKTKGEMEKKVTEIYKGNLKIIRPSLLMGHRAEFRLGEKVAIVFMKIFGILFIGPFKKYKGIHAWDLASAMIKSLELPKETIFVESDKLQDIAQKKTFIFPKHDVIKSSC